MFRRIIYSFKWGIISIICCIFCFTFSKKTNAQYYSKTYAIDGKVEAAFHCVENDDGYVLVGHADDEISSSPLHRGIFLYQLDLDGNIVNSRFHFNDSIDTDPGSSGAFVQVQNDSISYLLSTSGRRVDTQLRNGLVTAFNENLDIVWRKEFGSDSSEYLRTILPLGDNKFIGTGESQILPNDPSQLWVFAFDIEGNMLWEKYYGGNEHEFSSNAIKVSDNKFIISGLTYSYSNPHPISVSFNASNLYLVGIDSLGNQLWDHTVLGEGFDLYPRIAEGGYYVQPIESPVQLLPPGEYERIYAQIDTTNGHRLWADTLQDSNSITIQRIQKLSNNDLLLIYPVEVEGVNSGLMRIVRMDSNRNKIWERTYATGNVTYGRLYDFFEDDYGDLIFCGALFKNDIGSTDAWLLKLNSEGCLGDTSCGRATGIIDLTPPNKVLGLTIFPNPSSNTANLSIENSSAYLGKTISLLIYNNTGELVFEKPVQIDGSLPYFKVDVSNWANGNYIAAVQLEGKLLGSGQFQVTQ